jgi:hypothetical protein
MVVDCCGIIIRTCQRSAGWWILTAFGLFVYKFSSVSVTEISKSLNSESVVCTLNQLTNAKIDIVYIPPVYSLPRRDAFGKRSNTSPFKGGFGITPSL